MKKGADMLSVHNIKGYVSPKTEKIQHSSYINACADLQKNRDNMLRVVKNSEY